MEMDVERRIGGRYSVDVGAGGVLIFRYIWESFWRSWFLEGEGIWRVWEVKCGGWVWFV